MPVGWKSASQWALRSCVICGTKFSRPLHEAVLWQIGLGPRLHLPRGGDVEQWVADFVGYLECADHV